MAAAAGTNPVSAVNIDPNQQLAHATITGPNDPPMGIPSQWGYQPLQNPVPGAGTAQYQSALNPMIAPNLSEYPLGVDPMMWNTYLGNSPYSDYSWNNQMAGVVSPSNPQSWIMQYLTPQQQSQVTPAQLAALQSGGSTTQPSFNMLGGLGGLGGYSPQPWPNGQATPGIGTGSAGGGYIAGGSSMGSANPMNVMAMQNGGMGPGGMPPGMGGGQQGGQGGFAGGVYSTAPQTPVNYAQQYTANNPTPQPLGTYPLATVTGGANDLPSQIYNIYKSIMGRAPTQDTLDEFTNELGSGHATVDQLQQTLNSFVKTNGPLGNQHFNNPQDAIWMNAMDQGRSAVAGINRMPFMFSNYAGVPSDPSAAFNEFYPKTTLTDYQAQLLGMAPGQPSAAAASTQKYDNPVQVEARRQQILQAQPNISQTDMDNMLRTYDQSIYNNVQPGSPYQSQIANPY